MKKGRFVIGLLFVVIGLGLIYLHFSEAGLSPEPNTMIIISHPEFPDEEPDTTHFYLHTLEEAKTFSNKMENSNTQFMFTKEVSIYYRNILISEFCR